MITVGRSWELGNQYRFGFNGKEVDNEIAGNDNALDFRARIYDSRLGRWFTSDPADGLYPFESTYMFAGNNPIYYIDEEGKWKVRFADNNDHSKGIVLEAEKDDDLQTLATQLGIPYEVLVNENVNGKDWSKGVQLEGKWLRAEDLPGVEAFQAINEYLAREDIEQTNCSNCAMGINGFDQPNAWPIGEVSGKTSTEVMSVAENNIENKFENIPEKEAQFGDLVTYKDSETDVSKSGDVLDYANYKGFEQDSPEFKDLVTSSIEQSPIQHYSIVILKTPDGNNIQQVFEKVGSDPAQISNYPPKSDWKFTPSPSNKNNSGINSPVYTKKPN